MFTFPARRPTLILLSVCLSSFTLARLDARHRPQPHPRFSQREVTPRGGRFSWRHDDEHDSIVFDAVNWRRFRGTEVYEMSSDGQNAKCLTFRLPMRRGHIGNPAWLPDGSHFLLQCANEQSRYGPFNHPSFGLDNDLYIIDASATTAKLLLRCTLHAAILAPTVSPDAKTLVFAERVPTGRPAHALSLDTPGGENPWDHWRLHVASFHAPENPKDSYSLGNHRTLEPCGPGFYEPCGFTPDGSRLLFAYSASNKPRLDDLYTISLDGDRPKNLTKSKDTFEAHGAYSPSGQSLAFVSSRVSPRWKAKWSRPGLLKTELYLLKENRLTALTHFNRYKQPLVRSVVTDCEWDSTGARLLVLVETFHKRRPREPRSRIVELRFDQAQ